MTGPAQDAAVAATENLAPHELRGRILARVEQRLTDFLAAERGTFNEQQPDSVELLDTVAAMVSSGGKRLRPAFCVAGYLAAGGDPESPQLVDAAAALEFLHTFVLMHDDVMDDADLRRGDPTTHIVHTRLHEEREWRGDPRRYGEGVAILGGDLAHVFAHRLMQGMPPKVLTVWSELCTELMSGQFLDMRAAARFRPDPPLARHIALFKSARYTISRPLAVGAALAGNDELLGTFEEYGQATGEAFQLRDDLLDAFGSTQATGKPTWLDFKQHKMTLLMSFAMRDEPEVAALVGDDLSAVEPERLHALLMRTGIRDRVEAVIDAQVKVASEAVRATSISPELMEELTAMAHAVAYRDA
ncbi:polyprenyl synthetase family protein [Streptomyces profundus]|uniref:polyprenyl synthetase family protein n=1 Tax=Streptomyces profundus TaxID=2867410 RepID=UPI001D15E589|nr:polyprenyl synthetase family protein [Streptomyces sp. MA3_2.13]